MPKPRLVSSELRISGTRSITSKMRQPKVFAATMLWMLGRAAIRPTKPVISAISIERTSF